MSNMREFINLHERWENKPSTFTTQFPVVLDFEDYHEIDHFATQLSKLFKTTIKGEEWSGQDASGRYWGVFWVGKSPTKKLVQNLLTQIGYEARDDDY